MSIVETQVNMQHEEKLFKSVAKELEAQDPVWEEVLDILKKNELGNEAHVQASENKRS